MHHDFLCAGASPLCPCPSENLSPPLLQPYHNILDVIEHWSHPALTFSVTWVRVALPFLLIWMCAINKWLICKYSVLKWLRLCSQGNLIVVVCKMWWMQANGIVIQQFAITIVHSFSLIDEGIFVALTWESMEKLFSVKLTCEVSNIYFPTKEYFPETSCNLVAINMFSNSILSQLDIWWPSLNETQVALWIQWIHHNIPPFLMKCIFYDATK